MTAEAGDRGTMPHDPRAEAALLGAVLLDPNVFPIAQGRIEATDFYKEGHRAIWLGYERAASRGLPCDVVTVGRELKAMGKLQTIGGSAYLVQLQNETPAAVHALHYAKIVRDSAALRAVIGTCRMVEHECMDPMLIGDDAREHLANRALGQLGEAVAMLTRQKMRPGGPAGRTRLMNVVRRIWERIEAPPDQPDQPGYTFGFPTLDAKCQLPDADLTALAGDPGGGKSALLRHFVEHWEAIGLRPHVIVTEDRLTHYVIRTIANRTGMNGRVVSDAIYNPHKVKPEERQRVIDTLIRWLGGGKDWPDWTAFEGANMSVEQVAMEARRAVEIEGAGLVAIETFTRIRLPRMPGANKVERVDHNLEVLAGLGPELGVPVVVTCHLKRKGVDKGPPTMHDLRDSGNWENYARLILITHGQQILVAKANHGEPDPVDMVFDGPTTTWRERTFSDRNKPKSWAGPAPSTPDGVL